MSEINPGSTVKADRSPKKTNIRNQELTKLADRLVFLAMYKLPNGEGLDEAMELIKKVSEQQTT